MGRNLALESVAALVFSETGDYSSRSFTFHASLADVGRSRGGKSGDSEVQEDREQHTQQGTRSEASLVEEEREEAREEERVGEVLEEEEEDDNSIPYTENATLKIK